MEPLSYGRAHSADPEFTVETARAVRAQGNWEQGAVVLVEGLMAGPSPRLVSELVDFYRQSAPRSCAVREPGGSPTIDMDCPLVHGHVCAASSNVVGVYRRNGQTARADLTARSAVQDLGCPAEMFR
jgi:hypothetical protein